MLEEVMARKLCTFISWYKEDYSEAYYHFYTGYLQAMLDLGMQVEIHNYSIVYVGGKQYRVEDYKDA